MEKLKGVAIFLYKNFGPLIVFYIANHFWGLKTAILVSLVFTVIEVVQLKASKKEITTFFKFSVAMALVFGVLDLTLENAFFYKIEASITNLFTAFFFGITLFQPKPLIQQFAEQQGRTSKDQSEDKTFFFRLLTMVWTFYFIIKATIYLWINLNSDVEQGLIVRAIIGNVSFGIMLFVSIGLARPIWNLLVQLKVMPSARKSNVNIGLGEIKDADKMSKWFSRFAEQTAGSDMYQFLSKKIASDAELLALASTADQSQPVPNLFLATVNFLLYKDSTQKLRQFYPNHSGKPFSQKDLFENFKSFCLENSEKMIQIMKSRLVQTNEVRRCALLLPAVAEVAKEVQSEIALVDVGTSSGLNLLLDQYFYQYSDGTTIGKTDSRLKISCTVQNGKLKLDQLPKIGKRIGVDLNPIDLKDSDEVLWTLSLVWPDQVERVERLKSAIQVLNQHPVELRKGDGTVVLPKLTTEIPQNMAICVMHSFTLNQFSAEARNAFENLLCELSNQRDIWRISLEWLGTESPQMNLDHYSTGKLAQRKTLAICHQHGEWINWLQN